MDICYDQTTKIMKFTLYTELKQIGIVYILVFCSWKTSNIQFSADVELFKLLNKNRIFFVYSKIAISAIVKGKFYILENETFY